MLHLLPEDLARGAQQYASQLGPTLNTAELGHEIWTLFDTGTAVLEESRTLGLSSGTLRRAGFDPRAAWRLARLLHQRRPAAVVAHGSEPLKYAAAVVPRGIPIVYLRIGVAAPFAQRGFRRLFHRALAARAQIVACVSDDVREDALGLGVPSEGVVVIPNGRDPSVYSPAREDDRAGGRCRLLFVGHLTPTKRPGLFVEVVEALMGRGVDVAGTVVGDGPLLSEMRKRGRAAGVEVLGRRDDVPNLLRASDIFVFTSVRSGEGMPGVLIEAALSGLPIVSTAVPGASNVVRHGETGFVVGIEDREELLNRVEQLVTDVGLRRRMSRRARRWAVEHFAFDHTADQWRELLESVIEPCRPGLGQS